MAKYIVIGVQSYDFKDDNGKSIKGNHVFFLDESEQEMFRGFKTGKMSVPDSMVKAFSTLPGVYDIDFSVRVGAGGRVAASINSVGFIAPIKFLEEKGAKV
jgi:hypothetical protein